MRIREWLSRHATSLALAGAVLLNGGAAKAQLFGLSLPTAATTDKGSLIGKITSSGRQFLGVPYAAPPTGANRWKAPAPERAYLLRDATRFAKHCAQVASPFGDASTSEDCLYLNVFAPSALETLFRPAPVMVWFHPGAFQSGQSDDYNPAALVKKGFVVVTVNYRLGALGFMAHPALTAESREQASGNYGIMDQQAALRWVQRNIRSFGGDPRSVTIFGESAGAVSVYAHLASPDSAGLFHRAIAQSGTYAFYTEPVTQAQAETAGQTYAAAVGCPNQALACLRAVPVSTLLAKQDPSPVAYLPTIDAAVLPESIFNAFYYGRFNKVPLIQGTTQDEYRLFVALRELQGFPTNAQTYESNIVALLGLQPETAHTLATFQYSADKYENSESLALAELGTDLVFACRSRTLAHYIAAHAPVYVYEFDDKTAPQDVLPSVSFPYGAYHGSEVQYILDSFDGAPDFTSDQKGLADLIKNYWTRFAKTGNPNGGNAPAWPQYRDVENSLDPEGEPIYMELDHTPRAFNSLEFLTDHGCYLWGYGY